MFAPSGFVTDDSGGVDARRPSGFVTDDSGGVGSEGNGPGRRFCLPGRHASSTGRGADTTMVAAATAAKTAEIVAGQPIPWLV
jgi:hypothetical protein